MEFPCRKFDVGIRKKRKKNLTLQNYLHFIESQKQLDLTVDLLNNKAIKDLISLNQMECAITSFKTVNSENYSMLRLENENTSSSESNLSKKKQQRCAEELNQLALWHLMVNMVKRRRIVIVQLLISLVRLFYEAGEQGPSWNSQEKRQQ